MSGYHQVELAEPDRAKTAFITKHGLFEYTRMPFGLCNAPSTFQRAMELVLRGLQWIILLIYLDDVIVTGRNFKEHLQHLRSVLDRFRQAGIKLKAKKCRLFQTRVPFLGHVVSEDGVATNPDLVKDVQQWPMPCNIKQLQAFLGLTNYYRRFIQDYASIAAPLHDLTRKNTSFQWTALQQHAFETLKRVTTTAPVLAYLSAGATFTLDTDASNSSIGAVLSQQHPEGERVIAFASRRLGPAQERYCVTRRELLAIVAFTHHFRHYLLGQHFQLRTDHSSLLWLFRFRSPEGQLARWLEELSQYSFSIQHRSGTSHGNADALSRVTSKPECDCYQAGVSLESLPCHGCAHCQKVHENWSRFEQDVDDVLPLATRRICEDSDDDDTDAVERGDRTDDVTCNWVPSMSQEQVQEAQEGDPDLKVVRSWLLSSEDPQASDVRAHSLAVRSYFLTRQQFSLVNGVLCYNWIDVMGQKSTRLVVPRTLRREVIRCCHDPTYSGHQGKQRTLDRVKSGFHWFGLSADVDQYVATCAQCGSAKKFAKRLEPRCSRTIMVPHWTECSLMSLVRFP